MKTFRILLAALCLVSLFSFTPAWSGQAEAEEGNKTQASQSKDINQRSVEAFEKEALQAIC